jgi:hypothetical protein
MQIDVRPGSERQQRLPRQSFELQLHNAAGMYGFLSYENDRHSDTLRERSVGLHQISSAVPREIFLLTRARAALVLVRT